jgi:hypothetical protein
VPKVSESDCLVVLHSDGLAFFLVFLAHVNPTLTSTSHGTYLCDRGMFYHNLYYASWYRIITTATPLAVKWVTNTWVLAMWQYELVGAALTSDVSSVAVIS